MSNETDLRTGQVTATPEGGPFGEGAPTSAHGAGQVRITPEGGPLTPPTMRDHMQGPILGLDDVPAASRPPAPPPPASPAAGREEVDYSTSQNARETEEFTPTRTREDDAELRKWPPYSGKPVSEVRWDALRYAAPIVSQAEKLAIQAIGLSGRGLSRLARYLEARRAERDTAQGSDASDAR